MRGIGRYVTDLARGLVALAPADLTLSAVERLPWFARPVTSEDLAATVARLTADGAPAMKHVPWAYRVRFGMARACRAVRPDILHMPHPNTTPIGSTGCPRIVTCHDLIPTRFPEHYSKLRDGFGPGRKRLDARRYGSAAHIIAVSQATADDLMRIFGTPAAKITVVHNGVDPRLWEPHEGCERDDALAIEHHELRDRPYVLYVGDGDWRKNVPGMFAAFARARRRVPELQFAWAAMLRDSTQSNAQQIARALGVDNAVHFLGYVSDADLAALYRQAVCQLFISRIEGFGYPPLEAMAAGCAVVAARGSSLSEIVADAAITVDAEDHAAAAEGIVRLATDAAERHDRIRAGRARAATLTIDKMARETLHVYRSQLDA